MCNSTSLETYLAEIYKYNLWTIKIVLEFRKHGLDDWRNFDLSHLHFDESSSDPSRRLPSLRFFVAYSSPTSPWRYADVAVLPLHGPASLPLLLQ
jgi:hypothetical protein